MTHTIVPVGKNNFVIRTDTLAMIQLIEDVPEKQDPAKGAQGEVHIYDSENGEYGRGFNADFGFDLPQIAAALEKDGCTLIPISVTGYRNAVTSWINPKAIQIVAVEKVQDEPCIMINLKDGSYIRTELPADKLDTLMDAIHQANPDMMRVESKKIKTDFSGYTPKSGFAEFNASHVEAVRLRNEAEHISPVEINILMKSGAITFKTVSGRNHYDIRQTDTFKRMEQKYAGMLKIDTTKPDVQFELNGRASEYAKKHECRLAREFMAEVLAKAPALTQIPGAKDTAYINSNHVVWARASEAYAAFVLQKEHRPQSSLMGYDLELYFQTPGDAQKAVAILQNTPKP